MLHLGARLLQATGDIQLPVHMAHLTFEILVLGLTGSDPSECDSWVHQCTDLFCIGKLKFFDHPFNIATLVDRYSLSRLISLDFES